MIGKQIGRVARHPKGEIDRFVTSGVEADQQPAGLVADVLDGMAIALRDIGHVAFAQRLDPVTAMGTEQRDVELTVDHVLPLVRIRMPVQLAQSSRVEVQDDPGHGLRDRETARADPPFAAELVDRVGLLGQEPVFVRCRRRIQRTRHHGRRDWATHEVGFLGRKSVEGLFGLSEVLGQQALRRVAQPVGDAESAELGKVAVIEDENEMTRFVAQAGEGMGVAAGKIPDIARIEVVDLGGAGRIERGGAHTSLEHEGPFRGGRMPVKLPRDTRLQAHGDTGDAFGDRQLCDRRLLAEAAAHDFALGLLQGELERRQLLARKDGVRHVVLEGKAGDVVDLPHRGSPASRVLCAKRHSTSCELRYDI